eukprot:5617120-Prymnesium_polylepis.1
MGHSSDHGLCPNPRAEPRLCDAIQQSAGLPGGGYVESFLRDHFTRASAASDAVESAEVIVALLILRRLSRSDFRSEHVVEHSSLESGLRAASECCSHRSASRRRPAASHM